MKNTFTNTQNGNRGFILFVALLTSSFLLAVGLGVSSLAIRGFQLTSNTTESIKALYAANAGIECALYWDLKSGTDPFAMTDATHQKGGQTLDCSRFLDIDGNEINGSTDVSTDHVGGSDTNAVWFWLSFRSKQSTTDSSGDGPCVYVTIKKTIPSGKTFADGQFKTVIDAYGYNLHGRSGLGLTCKNGLPTGSPDSVTSSPPSRVERLLEATY